ATVPRMPAPGATTQPLGSQPPPMSGPATSTAQMRPSNAHTAPLPAEQDIEPKTLPRNDRPMARHFEPEAPPRREFSGPRAPEPDFSPPSTPMRESMRSYEELPVD